MTVLTSPATLIRSGIVSYCAAPSRWPRVFCVSEVRSRACDWLKLLVNMVVLTCMNILPCRTLSQRERKKTMMPPYRSAVRYLVAFARACSIFGPCVVKGAYRSARSLDVLFVKDCISRKNVEEGI